MERKRPVLLLLSGGFYSGGGCRLVISRHGRRHRRTDWGFRIPGLRLRHFQNDAANCCLRVFKSFRVFNPVVGHSKTFWGVQSRLLCRRRPYVSSQGRLVSDLAASQSFLCPWPRFLAPPVSGLGVQRLVPTGSD